MLPFLSAWPSRRLPLSPGQKMAGPGRPCHHASDYRLFLSKVSSGQLHGGLKGNLSIVTRRHYFPRGSFMFLADSGVRGLPSGFTPFAWSAKEIMSRYSLLFRLPGLFAGIFLLAKS